MQRDARRAGAAAEAAAQDNAPRRRPRNASKPTKVVARAPKAAGPAQPKKSPAELARSCLARGDQRCAVRALEGRASNAQELALLIETYRALGDSSRAVRNMQRFVKRYPNARQAPQYRQFLAKHGR